MTLGILELYCRHQCGHGGGGVTPGMDRPVFLSLFRGIGLLDRAFAEVFPETCIVCGPDLLWGSDICDFHAPAGVFTLVFGGPPCQRFSQLASLVRSVSGEEKLAPDLIPEFERVVGEAHPLYFLMENVPGAPVPAVPGYHVSDMVANNRWIGDGIGHVQNRRRRFSFGCYDHLVQLDISPDLAVFENPEYRPAACASGTTWQPIRIGDNGRTKARFRGRPAGIVSRSYLAGSIAAQGLEPEFLAHSPFTVAGQVRMVGNGVPLPMGRAIARAVRRAMGYDDE